MEDQGQSNQQDNTKRAADEIDRRDIVLILGLFLTAVGAGLIYPPAALIIPGLILTGIAIFGVRG